MHISIESQEDNTESIICIDRAANHAEIIKLGDPTHLTLLMEIAFVSGAQVVYTIAGAEREQELREVGWKETDLKVMSYEGGKRKL